MIKESNKLTFGTVATIASTGSHVKIHLPALKIKMAAVFISKMADSIVCANTVPNMIAKQHLVMQFTSSVSICRHGLF